VYDKPKLGASRTCTASNFGGPNDSSVGSHTANGEAFDWHQNLVAHRTLPFGSEVSVTYKGKTITGVPVKDNGPSSTKAGDVCIDLSYGLYEQLAKPGTGHIVVTWKVTKLNGKHRKMVV
jgi:rare lipoprotein A